MVILVGLGILSLGAAIIVLACLRAATRLRRLETDEEMEVWRRQVALGRGD